jgi:hypothetical protein
VTKKEAAQILAVLKAAYPTSYNGMTKEEAMGTVTVWSIQFSDIPVDVVMVAVQKIISQSKFPPTVAEVKETLMGMYYEAHSAIIEASIYKNATEQEILYLEKVFEATSSLRNDESFGMSIPKLLRVGGEQLCAGSERKLLD